MLLLSISFSSALAIAKVLFVIAAGALMAKIKILSQSMSTQLGTLVFTVCVPCMLFVQIGDSLTIQTLVEMSVVILYAVTNIVFGLISGMICLLFFEKADALISLIASKLRLKNKITNKLKKSNDPTLTRTLTKVVNSKLKKVTTQPKEESGEELHELDKINSENNNNIDNNEHNDDNSDQPEEKSEDVEITITENFNESNFSNFAPMIEENEPTKQPEAERKEASSNRWAVRRTILVACTFGNAASMALGLIGSLYPPDRHEDLQLAISYVSVYMSISQSLMYSIGYVFLAKSAEKSQTELAVLDDEGHPVTVPIVKPPLKTRIFVGLKKLILLFLTPPSAAVIIASFVALIPFLKKFFFTTPDPFFPNYPAINPPFGFASSAMEMIGNAAIPCITMVLGANLVNGTKSKDVRISDIITVTFSKLIISPIFGIISTYLGYYYFNIISNDVMWLVLLLETATPPAQSLIVLFGKVGQGEKQLSTILFYTYLLSVIFMTVFLCIFYIMIDGYLEF